MARTVKIGDVAIGGRNGLALIAGPCVIEGRKECLDLAARLVKLAREASIPFVFKASYDKANRTSIDSYRGPGIDEGLDILAEIRERFGVPVLTDVHTEQEATKAAAVVDAIQIPAFLCRQTDLLLAAGETGIPVNIKKGQFLAAVDMLNVVKKIESTGNRRLILTERGSSFGYQNLVADMRNLPAMRELGYPVTFDATHSVQRPGGAGTCSGGDSHLAPGLARAAVAVGCDAVFIETHVNPRRALSDGANAIPFRNMRMLWKTLRGIDEIVR
jgi:2-dehydro-3-deoxyphosphooctonate aldolase (KDO 8-P synthase)